MEKRQKLPLPPGDNTWRGMKKPIKKALAVGAVLAGFLAGYLFFSVSGDVISSRAFLSGEPLELRASAPGLVEYVAKAGQEVAAGEMVFRIDSSRYAASAQEAAKVVEEQAGAIPQRSRNLMLRYLAIPESEADLEAGVNTAAAAEKKRQSALKDLTDRQAVFSLELRRLELKRQRLAEEESRMEAMRVEEELIRASIKAAEAEYEAASLARAAGERKLQSKRELGRALRSLPLEERERLFALQQEFNKMYEAELQIAQAGTPSPQSGKVLYAAVAPGDEVKAGDIALYLLPEGADSLWVTAYFNQHTAKSINTGSPCSVTFEGEATLTLPGVIAARLPYLESPQAQDIPFKVTLKDASPLVGKKPGAPAVVSLPK